MAIQFVDKSSQASLSGIIDPSVPVLPPVARTRDNRSRAEKRRAISRMEASRGALSNPAGRFEIQKAVADMEVEPTPLKTDVTAEIGGQLVTRNASPDISFNRSINPYRGCEHGCSYCYARPNHSYVNLSPGLDFESRLYVKTNAPEALRDYFNKPRYRPEVIALGTATDVYQPIEKDYQITRQLLEVFLEYKHPVSITTKSDLILRDLDILKQLAELDLVHVTMSVTTLDRYLSRIMEPRASTPQKRLHAIRVLSDAGIPVSISLSPVIPAINDQEMEAILAAGKENGASQAYYIILRLPHEVKNLFSEWLATHFPDRARHVLSVVKSMHGDVLYTPEFGTRMRGTGPYAKMLSSRFQMACKRYGLRRRQTSLSTAHFKRPANRISQLDLFDHFTGAVTAFGSDADLTTQTLAA